MNRTFAILAASLLAASAQAADSGTQQGIGLLVAPKIGFYKTTTDLSGAFYAGAEIGYRLPFLDRHLVLAIDGSWQQPHLIGIPSDPQITMGGVYVLHEQQLGFNLLALYRFDKMFGALTPYAGAGPGAVYHRATMEAYGQTYVETETKFGAEADVGAEYALGPGAAFLELHYHFTRVDFLSTGNVHVGGFLAAGAGYRFQF